MQTFSYHTPIGAIRFIYEQQQLIGVDIFPSVPLNSSSPEPNSEAYRQIVEYINGTRQSFDINYSLNGTAFQTRVWHALLQIPYGQTRTYGELAEQLNTSARAVGNACRANPLPLIIPCHRIVAKTSIGGFSGQTTGKKIHTKLWLLNLEKKHIASGKNL